MTKRLINEFDEKVLRLVHHDFGGLSQKEAAKRLSISTSTVSKALSRVRAKAPQLFPILTQTQKTVCEHVLDGSSYAWIADTLSKSEAAIKDIVYRMKKKGVIFPRTPKTVRYQTFMDSQIKEKF